MLAIFWLLIVFQIEAHIFRQAFRMQTNQLDQVYRRAAIVAFLKAKAKHELASLPYVHQIYFEDCSKEARTPVELAKCVRPLLSKKTTRRRRETNPKNPMIQKPTKTPKLKRRRRNIGGERKPTISEISEPTTPRCKTPTNVANLRRVERFFGVANECMKYIKELGIGNSEIGDVAFGNHDPGADSAAEQLKALIGELDAKGLSFFSPKILNVIPNKGNGTPSLFSPTVFSFHDEGVLPLPGLLRLSVSNECEVQEWIDLLMEMSGASQKLDNLLIRFEEQMQHLQEVVFPKIREFQRQDTLWKKLRTSLTKDQHRALDRFGYTKMTEKQMRVAYHGNGLHPPVPALANLFNFGADHDYILNRMVEDISDLEPTANLSDILWTKRSKRKTRNEDEDGDEEGGGGEDEDPAGYLAPYAMSNQISQPSFLGNLILSPHAFINELFNPRFLGSDIISPRAFVATTLSPFAMVARVVAPAAFRVQTLSPQALTAIILVPEAFLAIILSPRTLEVRVLSPEVLSVAVLSPSSGMVRVLSPASANCFVLSPTILAANVLSTPELNIEVLSPSIMVADDGT